MLTLDLLFAVLRGLPASYLSHLELPWRVFCGRIQRALDLGQPPMAALKQALEHATEDEVLRLCKAIGEVNGVALLPDLSFRQRQALVALRYQNVASLSHLSRLLNWDRAHTYHRLSALVRKGYALKFYGDNGPSYLAIYEPVQSSVKYEAFQLIQEFVAQLRARQGRATSATTATLATRATPAKPQSQGELATYRRLYSLADLQPAEINDG